MYSQFPLPSWNPGDRPAPWWTRRTPRTVRPAGNSAQKKKISDDFGWKGCGVIFLGLGAYGVEAVHGEDVDGRAATALGLAPNTVGGVHGVAGLRRVEHEEAAGRRKRRWRLRRRRRGPHESEKVMRGVWFGFRGPSGVLHGLRPPTARLLRGLPAASFSGQTRFPLCLAYRPE